MILPHESSMCMYVAMCMPTELFPERRLESQHTHTSRLTTKPPTHTQKPIEIANVQLTFFSSPFSKIVCILHPPWSSIMSAMAGVPSRNYTVTRILPYMYCVTQQRPSRRCGVQFHDGKHFSSPTNVGQFETPFVG